MSTAAFYEPHKFSAGALALVVHGLFFTLLFFGFNWHVKPPQNIQVDMWDKLPDPTPEIVPAPLPPPVLPPPVIPPVAPKVVEPIAPTKGEIELKDKKKKKNERSKKEKPLAKAPPPKAEKNRQTELDQQRAQEKQQAAAERTAKENERIQELKAKMRAEMDAATQGEVARYKDLISAKISRNIVMPPDVPENAEAKFIVIVLPGGSVADVKLETSSGNAAYDSAAERAIYKAQPLPVPQDADLARMFRELRLSVKP